MVTPTNDAPVTVEETLRWYAEMTEMTLGSSETGRRALEHDGGRRAYACLAALASAPAGDGVAARLKYDAPQGTGQFEVFDPEPDNHHSALYLVDPNGAAFNVSCWDEVGLDIARAEWMRDTLNAALVRPRAAVGEQSRASIARAVHGALSRANINAYLHMPDDTAEKVADAILALQSPPAKVEG